MDSTLIREHITVGRPHLALKVMETGLCSTKHIPENEKRKLLDDCILLKSRLADLNNKFIQGFAERHTDNQKCEINFAVLLLLRTIENRYFQKSTISEANHLQFVKQIEIETEEELEYTVVRIKIKGDYSKFTKQKQQDFLDKLSAILKTKAGEISIQKLGIGSIKMEIELPKNKLKDLLLVRQTRALHDYQIIFIKAAPQEPTDKTLRDEEKLQALCKRFQEGDSDAIGELYQYFYPKLFAVAYKYLHNVENAADAVQDMFLKVLEKDSLTNIRSNVGAYLMRAVKYTSIDLSKRLRNYDEKLDDHRGHFIRQFFSKIEADENLIEAEKILDLMEQILTESELEVMRLTGQGYKSREIAEIIEKREGNIRYIRHMAWKKLKANKFIQELLGE